MPLPGRPFIAGRQRPTSMRPVATRPIRLRAALVVALTLASIPALAQRVPDLLHNSPKPLFTGTNAVCDVACRRAELFRSFSPHACLSGTFVSADIQILAQRDIRVRPDAEFWPHHSWRAKTRESLLGVPHNPWKIDTGAIEIALKGLPRHLAQDIRSRIGHTSDFTTFYTGADLIDRFGFKPCL